MPVAPTSQLLRRSPEHRRRTASPHDDDGHPVLSWDDFVIEVSTETVPAVVRCRGGLDFAFTEHLREVLAGIGAPEVVVDLSDLTFVDSTGISALLSARRSLLDRGATCSIVGAGGLVRRLFAAAELADVLDD